MKKWIIGLLVVINCSAVQAQNLESLSDYQSPSNELYWKNRMPNASYWQQDVHYSIQAVIDDKVESIEGKEKLIYQNNSPDLLQELYFHLYQNAFTPNSYLHSSRQVDKIKSVFGVHEIKGEGTSIHKLSINGKQSKFDIDNSILRVGLVSPLKPGEKIEIDIHFTTYWDKDDGGNIRRRMKTFRHGGKEDREFLHFDGVHWYPRISVYDRKFGWTTDQHLGKEFYGDYGIFDVNLDFPTQYIVEATGFLTNESEVMPSDLREKIDIKNYKTRRDIYTDPIPVDGTRRVWKFHAEHVHDFAFTADPTYRIGEVVWNGIRCIALAQEEHAHKWQPSAQFLADVVKTYSTDIGMYAYPKIIAADARDGMEYPMITLDGGSFPGHKGLIAHEVGHNWFFGMIGNNETYRASLDEGFTQFLTSWALRASQGIETSPNSIDDRSVFYGYMNHATGDNSARLNIHSDHFNSAARHGGGYGQVYYKTATMLYNLQYVLGDDLFLAALQNYFNEWKICHPYWSDFRQSIIDYTKVDLNWFFDAWIESTETIDYRVNSVKKSTTANTYKIEFERKGMTMPIDFAVQTKDGKTLHYHIPNTYFVKKGYADKKNKISAEVLPKWTGWGIVNPKYTALVTVEGGISDVQIDPSGRLADVYRIDNSKKCPVNWHLDKLRRVSFDFRKYQASWRPDIWYNSVDGIKAGVQFEGNYFQHKHIFKLRAWYNTGVLSEIDADDRDLISYTFGYTNKLKNQVWMNLHSRMLDGYDKHGFSFTKRLGGDNIKAGMNFTQRRDGQYLIQQTFVNRGWDNAAFLEYSHPYKYFNGRGNIKLGLSNSGILSDYNYSEISLTVLNNTKLGKLDFRTRTYARFMDGSSIAPESALLLGGANNRELMGNKYTRSRGWIPDDWGTFARETNHWHQSGGLNLRGYTGYRATTTQETDTFEIFGGSKGASVNAELGIGRLIGTNKLVILKRIRVNPYLFADAGILGNQLNQWSDLRMDAGLGTTVSYNFRRFNKAKPIVLRIDLPLVLNRVAEEGGEYVAMRYVIGLNRAF